MYPLRPVFHKQAMELVGAISGAEQVNVTMTSRKVPARPDRRKKWFKVS